MGSPLPWSHTSLENFVSCPRSYYEQRVAKSVKSTQGPEAAWGERVHKAFELYHKSGVPLPEELAEHEPFMQKLGQKPGQCVVEQKIALDRRLQACGFFDGEVWFRGVIDYKKVNDTSAYLCDYKTGKPHNKFRQLMLFAIHTFIQHPHVNLVNAQYYWTKTCDVTRKVWGREDMPAMWATILPDLKQYRIAFSENVWQPRPSGLCGWCPVKSCEFWKPPK